jgi:hypothetical protein
MTQKNEIILKEMFKSLRDIISIANSEGLWTVRRKISGIILKKLASSTFSANVILKTKTSESRSLFPR